MERRRRSDSAIVGELEARRIATSLGRSVREARKRARLPQVELGRRVGVSQARLSEIERGMGERLPLATWVSLGIALERPLAVSFSRSIDGGGLSDAVHLDIQEALLALARRHGRTGSFELPTRPADPSHSVDVCLRDPVHRCLVILEAWNRFGDLGAAVRSSTRKLAEAEALAVATAVGGQAPFDVRLCWVIRDTTANREIVRRYPHVLRSRFPGSSARWVAALRDGAAPPAKPGTVWFDHRSGHVAALRLPA